MKPPQRLMAAGVAATLTTAILVGWPASDASATQPDHLVVLAGSPQFVAYADYPLLSRGKPDFSRGELHVFSDKGRDRDLGGGFGDADPSLASPERFSIVESALTASSAADPTEVRWWDLASNTHGVLTIPVGARWQGSVPGGFVVVAPDNETVYVEGFDSTITSFGRPLPAEVTAGGTITTLSGPNGLVSLGAQSGTASYQAYDLPATVVPLDLGSSTGSTGQRCSSVSEELLGCTDDPTEGASSSHLAVPLDGSEPRSYPGCAGPSIAVENRLAWTCVGRSGHPHFTAGQSNVRSSRVKAAAVTGVSAFGNYVTVGPRQHELIAIRNGHSDAHVLVSIPSPLIHLDDSNLRAAADAVSTQAVTSGALAAPPAQAFPAQILQASSVALIRAARAKDPSLRPRDTRSIMGPVPANLRNHVHHRPGHRHHSATRSLHLFSHAIADGGSAGLGTNATHGGATPAPYRAPDGVYVDPILDAPTTPTVSMVAIHTALLKIGQPYVWAAAGPNTFDCSGLTQWAYAHAGVKLIHYTGSQWNQGRLIKARDILPGDLILFSHLIGGRQVIHHVGIYLGAGWMINAPYTGQYVNVVKVPTGVAGIVRP